MKLKLYSYYFYLRRMGGEEMYHKASFAAVIELAKVFFT